MPSGLVTEWIMHNKPPKEFTHTNTHALLVTIATSNSSSIAALNINVRRIFQPPNRQGVPWGWQNISSLTSSHSSLTISNSLLLGLPENKPRNAWRG